MNFEEAMAYLYSRLPVFHNIGHRAYKPGLETTRAFCKRLGDPHLAYPTIHVAGTNGKGSVSNMLAAILQQAGYRTGLYTSPHLKDFNERIRVNGIPVPGDFVASFVETHQAYLEEINPSFFEATVAMAFDFFRQEQVDIAVIEVGLGGRLDSTNVIEPVVSVITNIGLDHTRQLGETLTLIAGEKGGIIKPGVPVVVSERQDDEIPGVLESIAGERGAPLFYGADYGRVVAGTFSEGLLHLDIERNNNDKYTNTVSVSLDLSGNYQKKNVLGVLSVVDRLKESGWQIPDTAVGEALATVTRLTGFKGRWTRLMERPFVVADTAHNLPGLRGTLEQFMTVPSAQRHFVLGFVSDKDISAMLGLLPRDAKYYFCAPSNTRAMPSLELLAKAESVGLIGTAFSDVNEALEHALAVAAPEDSIYIGGSTFVVADLHLL
ncbi:folylpolyglutamate synthase/dihydrofolate synthase family protein [Ravibacter arvi]|uniref:Dihydrofolate synthase/folylpolyglutamate synthase n=1 Tax=Ravibacter arvi TaxID=2051041 RepID=A0ABP8LMR0_9BACT